MAGTDLFAPVTLNDIAPLHVEITGDRDAELVAQGDQFRVAQAVEGDWRKDRGGEKSATGWAAINDQGRGWRQIGDGVRTCSDSITELIGSFDDECADRDVRIQDIARLQRGKQLNGVANQCVVPGELIEVIGSCIRPQWQGNRERAVKLADWQQPILRGGLLDTGGDKVLFHEARL